MSCLQFANKRLINTLTIKDKNFETCIVKNIVHVLYEYFCTTREYFRVSHNIVYTFVDHNSSFSSKACNAIVTWRTRFGRGIGQAQFVNGIRGVPVRRRFRSVSLIRSKWSRVSYVVPFVPPYQPQLTVISARTLAYKFASSGNPSSSLSSLLVEIDL